MKMTIKKRIQSGSSCYLLTGMILLFIFALTSFFPSSCYSDIVTFKDRTEQKGLVIEETIKSIIFSTVEGEREIFFEDIEKFNYDEPEKNLYHQGLETERAGNLEAAIGIYQKAMQINPKFTKALDRIVYVRSILRYNKEYFDNSQLAKRRATLQRWDVDAHERPVWDLPLDKKVELLRSQLGIALGKKDYIPYIKKAYILIAPFKNRFKKQDEIISIWGESTKYEGIDSVIDKLVGPRFSQVKLTIRRRISVNRNAFCQTSPMKGLGLSLKYIPEGLIVAAVQEGSTARLAGIEKDDFVTTVNGKATRYLPLSKVMELMKGDENTSLTLTVNRTMWLMRGE